MFLVGTPLVRWGLERLVQTASPRFEVSGTATEPVDCLPLLQRQPADVVVLAAMRMRVAQLADFCATCGAAVLLISASSDKAWFDGAVIAGVRGIVPTGQPPDALLKAIEKVVAGELWIDRSAMTRILLEVARQRSAERNDPERLKIATLTPREREMIAAVASDASASGKVLAERLRITEHTLRNHLTSIYGKLGLYNRLDLYAYARRYSLHEVLAA